MTQAPKQKKIPQRKCVACSDRESKKQLMRIVKNKEGQIFVDSSGKANGRGAYVHLSEECIDKTIKGHLIEKAFKSTVPSELYDRLKEELQKIEK